MFLFVCFVLYIFAVFAGVLYWKLIVDQYLELQNSFAYLWSNMHVAYFYPGSSYFTKFFHFLCFEVNFYYIEDNAKLKCGGREGNRKNSFIFKFFLGLWIQVTRIRSSLIFLVVLSHNSYNLRTRLFQW